MLKKNKKIIFSLILVFYLIPYTITAENLIKYVPANVVFLVESSNFSDFLPKLKANLNKIDPGIVPGLEKEYFSKIGLPLFNLKQLKKSGLDINSNFICYFLRNENWICLFKLSNTVNFSKLLVNKLKFKKHKGINKITIYLKKTYINRKIHNRYALLKSKILFISNSIKIKSVGVIPENNFASNASYLLKNKIENADIKIYFNANFLSSENANSFNKKQVYKIINRYFSKIFAGYQLAENQFGLFNTSIGALSFKPNKILIESVSSFNKNHKQYPKWRKIPSNNDDKLFLKIGKPVFNLILNVKSKPLFELIYSGDKYLAARNKNYFAKFGRKYKININNIIHHIERIRIYSNNFTTKLNNNDTVILISFQKENNATSLINLLNKMLNRPGFKFKNYLFSGLNIYSSNFGKSIRVYYYSKDRTFIMAFNKSNLNKIITNQQTGINFEDKSFSNKDTFGLYINFEKFDKSMKNQMPIEYKIISSLFSSLSDIKLVSRIEEDQFTIKLDIGIK